MKHRHLNHERYTLAAIDSVINRGALKDWAEMIEAARAKPGLREDIARVCRGGLRSGDPDCPQNYYFWQRFAAGDESVLQKVDWSLPDAAEVMPTFKENEIEPTPPPSTIREIFAALDAAKVPSDFLNEAERDRSLPQERDWSWMKEPLDDK